MGIFRKSKKNLVIIGARGFGRECYAIFEGFKGLRIKGFLDDKKDALDDFKGSYPPILDSVESYCIEPEDVFICALGDPVSRKKYSEIIIDKGGEFLSYIDKQTFVNPTAQIGVGVIICGNCKISANAKIGNFSVIHPFSNIGHDVSVGEYSEIEPYVALSGGVKLNEMVTVHPHATILPHVEVGRCAIVGAGSVVVRNVKESTTVFGVPAKVLTF